MSRTIHLRPLQTGDACYLQDHHNRDGECIITITMRDGCATAEHVRAELHYLLTFDTALGLPAPSGPRRHASASDLASVAKWCADAWALAKADMPAEVDRDTEGDDSERYLDCHILATWEV